MNLLLKRQQRTASGIFSILSTEAGEQIACCLEHAYYTGAATYSPKIPNGTFNCVRGMHRLHNMVDDFETFEITDVVGHDDLLFHWGNYNKDSEGCILLGDSFALGMTMITKSRETFAEFMKLQENVQSFTLTVSG